jgi:Transposase and inactivated derivatives
MQTKNVDREEVEFVAFVGIDWADQRHSWALQVNGTWDIEQGILQHSPEAVEEWASRLAQRFNGRPVAIAIEQARGSLVYMLSKYRHLVLFPVHPAAMASYRKSFRPSGAKNDPNDAFLLLDILTRHGKKLRQLNPDTEETRTLQFLVEERRKFVHEKTRHSNRLTAYLKQYFPQILDWFADVSSPVVGDLLERWPTLQQLQTAKPSTLRRFLAGHNCRHAELIDKRLSEIRRAVPATGDQAVLNSLSAAVTAVVRILREVRQAIIGFDGQIEKLAQQHPDFAIFESFPGAGPVLAPRLIAALGTQRDRYTSAHQIQCYSGIAPVMESSGKQHWVHCRWACPKFLRQTFHEWALQSI